MLTYYLRLAWLSMRRTPAITLLMIGAIAVGIGATTTTLTVYHLMSSNPLAAKNDRLRAVTIDSWDPNRAYSSDHPTLAPPELTYRDAAAIADSGVADRAVIMRKTSFTLEPAVGAKPFLVEGRLATRDFFAMFDVPFAYGSGWDRHADETGEPVVVLSKETNDKAFGGTNSLGKRIKLDSHEYRVIGVLADWQPTPKVYDLNNGEFDGTEDVFVPFALGKLLTLPTTGNVNCWKPEVLTGPADLYGSECTWHQLWLQVDSKEKLARVQTYIDGYVAGQKRLGRLPRKMNNTLYSPSEWLERYEVVGHDSRLLLSVSFAFLAVCILNVVGLLLSRFLGSAGSSALRRALGASRGALFRQHLVEVGLIGAVAGIAGLFVGWLGLRGMQHLYSSFDRLTHLDVEMTIAALGLAILAGVLAGLYPAWRVCRVQPASYLKTQ